MVASESWRYNSYTKLYESGRATENYGDGIYKTIKVSGTDFTGVIKEDFRNIVYPSLKQKIENRMQEQIKQNPNGVKYDPEFVKGLENDKKKALNDLNELYHLSD